MEEREQSSNLDRLVQLTEFMPDLHPGIYGFGVLTAQRLLPYRILTPEIFVGETLSIVEDLVKERCSLPDGPFQRHTFTLNPYLLQILQVNITNIANKVYPADFAWRVQQVCIQSGVISSESASIKPALPSHGEP